MRLDSRNFSVKQVGSFWRVVGPGGKLIDGKYRLRQQALVALKSEVDKLLNERNFGFLKETSDIINNEIKKELDNGWNTEQRHDEHENDEKDGIIKERHDVRHENAPKEVKKDAKRQGKKRKVVHTKNISPALARMVEKQGL